MNRMVIGAGLLWLCTVASIALWVPSSGVDAARARPREQEVRRQLDRVKRTIADIERMADQGMLDMDGAARERSMMALSATESGLVEIRKVLQQP